MNGTLYVVGTPIGNLEDITERARRMLSEVDVVACEDTRVTGALLAAYKISKPLVSVQEHSTSARVDAVVERLKNGESVAYVSDAGTPGVNDPGGKLAARAMEAGVTVVPIPGASALSTAISVCGFPMSQFVYLGFLPLNGRARVLSEIAERDEASVFFESTHRIKKVLSALKGVFPTSRKIFVGRELTKMYETLYRGTLEQVIAAMDASSTKGEFTIIVAPKKFQ